MILCLFAFQKLEAAYNHSNYSVTVTTRHLVYKDYEIASLTDSSLTIYTDDSSKKTISITLFADDIMEIRTARHAGKRALGYVVPIGAGALIGGLLGKNLSGGLVSNPLSGIAPFIGAFFGAIIGCIIDAGSIHHYQIYLKQENFMKFRRDFQ